MSGTPDLLVTGARLDGQPVSLLVEAGLIAAIGPDVSADNPQIDRLDAGGGILCPPLINGHTHAAMTLFRGHGDDLPLMRWLEEAIWPVEAKLESEDVYWGARLACLEMIRAGTAGFWDMYWHPEATARAVVDSGLRAVIGPPLFDRPGADREALNRELEVQLDALTGFSERVGAAVAPHSIYTTSTATLEYAAGLAADRGLPVHIHLAETAGEVTGCLETHGRRPAHYLDDIGMLGEDTVLAHGVWLDREELELIADRGATVVTNPVANLKLAVGGVFPYREAARAGVAMALGTDGAGSNNSLDLLDDLKVFALSQRHAAVDAEVIPVGEALAVATGRRSRLVSRFGRPRLPATDPLTVGAPADFLVLDPETPELALGDLTSNLVYSANGSAVKDTIVAGRVLMRNHEVADQQEILAKARERANRLGL